MAFPLFHYPKDLEPPFTIVVEHQETSQKGSWQPSASIHFSKALRTSGFLSALPPEILKDFLLLLTFISPSGVCTPTLPELAEALRMSHSKARSRLNPLLKARWHGQPIVLCYGSESGLETYTLALGLLPLQEDGPLLPSPKIPLVSGEKARDYSRRTYARPRAEVEREIARINNWTLPGEPEPRVSEESPENALIQDLIQVGLQREQAEELVAHFDEVRIRRQLMWLPYRAVRRPAGFLIAAIKDDYAAPPGISRSTASETDPSHE